jgi:hypothetical protein
MKKLLLITSCSLALSAQAQITLDQSNAPTTVSGIDTLFNANIDNTVPSVAAATNARWDFSRVTYNAGKQYNKYTAASGFPSAQYSNEIEYELEPGTKYKSHLMFAVGAQGIVNYGEQLKRQAFNIGGPNDSLIVLPQNVTFTSPQTILPYPATMGTKWQASFSGTTDMIIKYPAFALNDPAQRKVIYTTNNEVVGWGLIWVAMKDGRSCGSTPVLQVQTSLKTIDSFYLNGKPADPFLLSQFDLKQGEVREVFQRNFYRAGEVTPIVSITFTDKNFTTVQDINIHRQRLKDPTSVKDVIAAAGVSLYPNPAKDVVSVSFKNAQSGNVQYEIVNMSGQKVANGSFDAKAGQSAYSINLPSDIATGIYFMNLNKNNERIGSEMFYIEK